MLKPLGEDMGSDTMTALKFETMIAAEPLSAQVDRVEKILNRMVATLSGMTHSPKCERPGASVEHGPYAVTIRCDGCGATNTTTRKKAQK
jgi:hypothetical protein